MASSLVRCPQCGTEIDTGGTDALIVDSHPDDGAVAAQDNEFQSRVARLLAHGFPQ